MPGTRIAAGWGTTRMKLERHYCKSLAFEVYLSAICQQVFKPDAACPVPTTALYFLIKCIDTVH